LEIDGFWLAYIITNEHLFVIYIIQSSCVSAYKGERATVVEVWSDGPEPD
jgi:hypothetical protein